MGKRDPPHKGGKHAGAASSSSSVAVAKDPKRAQLSSKQERKKGGSEYKKNWAAFNEQLRAYGLVLRTIGGDGNCLFRSLADQLCGRQDDHQRYRNEIVEYMSDHPLDFAPFVYDQTFDQYLAKMKKSGEWGGAAELAAASKAYGINITVHQYAAPRLENRYDPSSVTWNPDRNDVKPPLPLTKDTKTIHLSYHDAAHYSSVRNISDQHSFEPATTIVISDDAAAAASSSSSSSPPAQLTQAETIVLQSSGCKNLAKIRAMLKDCWNDANAVVEMLVAEQTMGLDINTDHEALAAQQAKEIETQRREEENTAAAARLRAKEQQQREEAHMAQQMSLLDQALQAERRAQQEQEQKQKREAAEGVEECKGDAAQSLDPAADDRAEAENEVEEQAPSDGEEAAGDDDAGAADGVAAASSSSSALAPTSAASAAASSSSSRPPRPKVHHAGRDKRMAAKHAKMLMDKAKRANKSIARKDKADMGAAMASAEVSAAASKLGAVRI